MRASAPNERRFAIMASCAATRFGNFAKTLLVSVASFYDGLAAQRIENAGMWVFRRSRHPTHRISCIVNGLAKGLAVWYLRFGSRMCCFCSTRQLSGQHWKSLPVIPRGRGISQSSVSALCIDKSSSELARVKPELQWCPLATCRVVICEIHRLHREQLVSASVHDLPSGKRANVFAMPSSAMRRFVRCRHVGPESHSWFCGR